MPGEAKRSEIKTFGAWMKQDEGRGRRNATLIFAMVSIVTAIIYVTFKVISLFEKKMLQCHLLFIDGQFA